MLLIYKPQVRSNSAILVNLQVWGVVNSADEEKPPKYKRWLADLSKRWITIGGHLEKHENGEGVGFVRKHQVHLLEGG